MSIFSVIGGFGKESLDKVIEEDIRFYNDIREFEIRFLLMDLAKKNRLNCYTLYFNSETAESETQNSFVVNSVYSKKPKLENVKIYRPESRVFLQDKKTNRWYQFNCIVQKPMDLNTYFEDNELCIQRLKCSIVENENIPDDYFIPLFHKKENLPENISDAKMNITYERIWGNPSNESYSGKVIVYGSEGKTDELFGILLEHIRKYCPKK